MVDENGMLDLHLDTLERSCFVELVLPDKNFFLFCFVLFFFLFVFVFVFENVLDKNFGLCYWVSNILFILLGILFVCLYIKF